MIVGDIIYNDEVDFNANYAIYKCKSDVCWDETEPIISTAKNGYGKPLDAILDMEVQYMTISNNELIIEVLDES